MEIFKKICTRLHLHCPGSEDEMEYRLKRGLRVGKNCHIYSAAGIDGAWPHLISIGDNVTIASNVTILAHDASTNVVKCETKLGRVTIGSNVFIGCGSIVLCNTHIGDNVVVGAGSVVSRDLPGNGVYAGVPARFICSIDEYRAKYENLRKIRPDFSRLRPWNEWDQATDSQRQQMRDGLSDGIGFI